MTLKSVQAEFFHDSIPPVPQGKYAHIVLVRETESFALFQTDGGLNVVQVRAGLEMDHAEPMSRVILFKRKQSSPERLTGRELLRRYGITPSVQGEGNFCDYNSKDFCKQCPDCIIYGYAIGDQGSEKSKVLVDSAYSITGYDESHRQFTFNALYESGTMTRGIETRASFGEQDHVAPQVFFPSVVTLRDPTEDEFIYVLSNVLRTNRYGAQETRTGRVDNRVVAVVFADGEIFSNLRLTQKVYDLLAASDKLKTPLDRDAVLSATAKAVYALLPEDNVVVASRLVGDEVATLVEEVNAIITDEKQLRNLLQRLSTQTQRYAENYGAKEKKEPARARRKGTTTADQ